MGCKRLAEEHMVPGLAPIDITTSATYSDIVDASEAHEIEFDVEFGVITGDSVVVTVEECDTIVPGASTAIAYKYQKSSAVGTDSMGAMTDATSSGVTITATDDNKLLRIYVDPEALTDGYPNVRVKLTPGGSMSECVVGIQARMRLRYPQEVPASQVD